MPFIPWIGLQTDEALFGAPLREPRYAHYYLFGYPVMLMSYLGTLKGLIYKFVFQWFGISLWSIRVPALILGAASLPVFYALLRRTGGPRAAWMGVALLSTDALYLLSSTFDWGPVVLQHLLWLTGMLLAAQSRYFWAGLVFGLALWDKALFLWNFFGTVVAVTLVYWPELRRRVTLRNAGLAAAGLLLGAAPLIAFNIGVYGTGAGTLSGGNAALDVSEVGKKIHLMRITFEGSAFFGWLVNDPHFTPVPAVPVGRLQSAAAGVGDFMGDHSSGWMIFALAVALPLIPFGRYRRHALFVLVLFFATWVPMVINRGTGGGVHHTILLWPAGHWLVALAFAGVADRIAWSNRVLAPLVFLVALSNALVVNQYYVWLIRYGTTGEWSDALMPLTRVLLDQKPKMVQVADWGMSDNIRLLSGGRLPFNMITDPLYKPELDAADRARVAEYLAPEGQVFVAHVDGVEVYPGARKRLEAVAAETGYTKQTVAVVPDRHGRPVFEVMRFVKRTFTLDRGR